MTTIEILQLPTDPGQDATQHAVDHGYLQADPYLENNEYLQAALAAAARGWPVIPMDGKTPRINSWRQQASCDHRKLYEWWNRWGTAGVGILTGVRAGLVVLDVDPRNGGDESLARMVAEHGLLPATYTVATGGGGQHFYFRTRGRTRSRLEFEPGLDLKAEGGLVVIPPTLHDSGQRYSVLDDRALADAPRWVADPYVAAAVEGEYGRVATASPGARNNALNVAALNLARHLDLSEDDARHHLTEAARAAGLDEAEIGDTFDSGYQAGKQKTPIDRKHQKGPIADEVLVWAVTAPWPGQHGARDRAVLIAHCRAALLAGSTMHTASQRWVIEQAAISQRGTASGCHERLAKLGVLVKVQKGDQHTPPGVQPKGTKWQLRRPREVIAIQQTTCYDLRSYGHDLARTLELLVKSIDHDLWRHQGLGLRSHQIVSHLMLSGAVLTRKDLATRCGVGHPYRLQRHLDRLVDVGLIAGDNDGYSMQEYDLDVAADLWDQSGASRVVGLKAAQQERHEIEREYFKIEMEQGDRVKRKRCTATTVKGTTCKRSAMTDCLYCNVHEAMAEIGCGSICDDQQMEHETGNLFDLTDYGGRACDWCGTSLDDRDKKRRSDADAEYCDSSCRGRAFRRNKLRAVNG